MGLMLLLAYRFQVDSFHFQVDSFHATPIGQMLNFAKVGGQPPPALRFPRRWWQIRYIRCGLRNPLRTLAIPGSHWFRTVADRTPGLHASAHAPTGAALRPYSLRARYGCGVNRALICL